MLTKNIKLTNLSSPRPLREREQSCLSSQAKATNAGEGSKQGFILLVTYPHPLRERVEFLSELCELRNSGVGLNQELTPTAPLSEGKLFSDTLRLNLASVVFPRHPIPECVMLNLFQHLTGLACDLPSCKILNSSKIEWETNTHNNIIKTDFLRFQDDNACTSPRTLREGVNVLGWSVTYPRPLWEGVNVLGWLVTIPRPLWEREKPFLSLKAKVTDSGEGLKTINQQSPPTPFGYFPLKGGRNTCAYLGQVQGRRCA